LENLQIGSREEEEDSEDDRGVKDGNSEEGIERVRRGNDRERMEQAQNSVRIEGERFERRGGEPNSEDDRSEEEEEESFNKASIVGVAGIPVLVRPEGDHGTREGSPVSRPEPRAEHQGGKGPIGVAYYEDLILRVGETIQRSARVSRPPSPIVSPRRDADTQTESIGVNPASYGETHEPRRNDTLDRIEHMVGELRRVQFQEASRRKRAQRAKKRREKRRRKGVVSAEEKQSDGPKGPEDGSVVPEAGGSQPPLDIWEPPTEESNVRTVGGESDRTAGNRTDGNPVEVGAQRPRKSPPPQSYRSLKRTRTRRQR
jgi:hypothetical protein